jgi:methylenetetrahydrofolate dehydrogenase (NADP+)/methenyltetrahydrofolate cyclohydrolase
MYTLIDGKKTASELKTEIAQEVTSLVRSGHRPPHLAAVLVGHNPSSVTYVNNKVKDCAEVGFKSTLLQLDENIDENELLSKIKELNEDSNIDAFIVQLPLPAHISEIRVTEAIDPSKDADGFHPVNIGRMVAGISGFLPATPFGVVELLDKYGISVSGKHCVIIGRSNIVGRHLVFFFHRKAEMLQSHWFIAEPEIFLNSSKV